MALIGREPADYLMGMVEEKPTIPFVLSLVGGVTILVVGLLLIMAKLIVPYEQGTNMGFRLVDLRLVSSVVSWFWLDLSVAVLLVFGVGFGSLVVFSAVMLYLRPRQHVVWSVLVLVFSLGSVFSSGGFFAGLVLGVIGGILGIIWKPTHRMAPPVPIVG